MTISPPGRTLPGRVSGRAAAAAEPPAQLAALRPLLAALPLAAKVALLTGADSWRTHACPAIGLRPMVTSDGPAGVRGTTKDERKPSASMPCPAALGATWDAELVHQVALALGAEARSKGVDILLAPTVNLMRTPLGGRGFEFFAEDPVLTARLATAYVRGVQDAGVAATVKHYTANDSETERWTYDAPDQRDRAARAVPGAVRGVRPGGGRLADHGRLQQRQRRADDRERPAAAGRAQGRVGLRRRRDVGLARGPQHRADRGGHARPVDAGPGRPLG